MKTDLVEIFQTIRAEMQPYAVMGFDSRINSDEAYDLWNEKNLIINGKEHNELHFAGVTIKENEVVFEFMPIHVTPELKSILHPSLLKLLKGDSNFHIKELDDSLLQQISDALAAGYKLHKQNEWV